MVLFHSHCLPSPSFAATLNVSVPYHSDLFSPFLTLPQAWWTHGLKIQFSTFRIIWGTVIFLNFDLNALGSIYTVLSTRDPTMLIRLLQRVVICSY